MNKVFLGIAGVVVALGALVFYFFNNGPEPATTMNASDLPAPAALSETLTGSETGSMESDSTEVDELKAGGNSYIDATGVYNFLYPNDYRLDESDKQHIRVYKTGPTQKGQTEMYDGVIGVFELADLGDMTLSRFIDERIKTSTQDGTSEIIEARKSYSINNYPGFTYSMRGLGESRYYVLQKDPSSKQALIIVTGVYDPGNLGFQEEVNSILSSIKFLK